MCLWGGHPHHKELPVVTALCKSGMKVRDPATKWSSLISTVNDRSWINRGRWQHLIFRRLEAVIIVMSKLEGKWRDMTHEGFWRCYRVCHTQRQNRLAINKGATLHMKSNKIENEGAGCWGSCPNKKLQSFARWLDLSHCSDLDSNDWRSGWIPESKEPAIP